MDGLNNIGKELTTCKGIWRVVIALLATLVGCFAVMGLSVLLLQGGVAEQAVQFGLSFLLLGFLLRGWANYCDGMADSIIGCQLFRVLTAMTTTPQFGVVVPTRTLPVPLSPPRFHLA